MNEAIVKLRAWAKGDAAPPDEVQIYPTNRCNLRCVFCFQQLKEYDLNDTVPDKRWLEIAEELCEMGVPKILISGGGEPMMSDATIQMMRIFKSHGVRGRMINNGTRWTAETIREAVKMGWDHITFSLDGPDAATHDRLRGGGFDKIIRSIKGFNEIQKGRGLDRPRKEIVTVLCRENYRKIAEMVELAHDLAVPHYSAEPVCVNNTGVEKIKLSEEEGREFLDEIIPGAQELAEKYNISTNFGKLLSVRCIDKTGDLKEVILRRHEEQRHDEAGGSSKHLFDVPCYEPWIWPKIEANGDVWPCSTTPLKANIRKRSFSEIWTGPEFTAFRKQIAGGVLSESCSNCVLTHLDTNRRIREELKDA
ncbi:MAG: radical SAM protein [archaeon]